MTPAEDRPPVLDAIDATTDELRRLAADQRARADELRHLLHAIEKGAK